MSEVFYYLEKICRERGYGKTKGLVPIIRMGFRAMGNKCLKKLNTTHEQTPPEEELAASSSLLSVE